MHVHSLLISILPLTVLPLVTLAAPAVKRDTAPIYDGSQVNGKTYDYVVVGGGLTGVVLAARLTEDSGRTVLVVEAGYNEEANSVVTDAANYQQAFDTWLDWAYKTVPQTSANGQQQTMRSGRALGGSTIINGLAWSKPHDFQIDAMEQVGNAGLNWNSLQTYMRRAENFQAPPAAQAAAGVTYNAACHASNGPINVQYDINAYPSNLERDFNSTVLKRMPYVTDLSCGNPGGAAPVANTRSGGTRIDAYRGYLWNKSKPNLTILSGANVGKVILSSDSTPRATGIEFRDEKGNTYTASARREVIMAAGSLKTPVILQQSGIGPRDVLASAGVTQRVDLPVGLNLIDQTTTTTDFSFNSNRGGGQPIIFPRFQDMVNGEDATRMRGLLQNNMASYAQAAVNSGSHSNAAGLQKVLEIQRDWILNKNVGFSESFDYSFGTTLGYDSWYLLPFGRGSVKIRDNQAYASNTAIDPKYFSNEFDRLAQGATARFTRTVSQSTPLSYSVTGESVPGSGVGGGASLDAWTSWAQQNYRSNWHPIGTAAMMSRDLGGCVDSRNKLYGVNGLRVVDASTLPFQVSSHLMSVLYGLAERAADIIKQDNSGTNPPTSSSSAPPTSSSSSSARPSSSSAAPPSTTGRAIHPNGDTTKCLQARGQADGALVEIRDCANTANQRWVIAQGTGSVKLAGTNYCLDAGNSPGNGVQAKVWTCYSGIPAQTWNYNSGNQIALPSSNVCIDLPDGNKSNGNVLQQWQCFSDNANQRWTV